MLFRSSSWKHHDLESGPTPSGRKRILSELSYLSEEGKVVTDHESGVRSATKDRNPMMGRHPEIKQLHLFNGFGSRGCTTLPLCASEMADFVLSGIPLPQKHDLARFSANHAK